MSALPSDAEQLHIGWASTDITPAHPVLIAGQFHARVSEGAKDPITATALFLTTESVGEQAILVSCDLVAVSDELRDAVRSAVKERSARVEAARIVLNGTHTHTGPEIREPSIGAGHTSNGTGVDVEVQPPEEYIRWAAEKIAETIVEAYESRSPGGVAFGLGQALIGRNRRWVDVDGRATMYGNTDSTDFSHIEGGEDHSVNVMATYGRNGALTGLVLNVPCPSQVTEGEYTLSADYWHETRLALRDRLGPGLYVLPQCSAAGDQSPHPILGKRAEERMLSLAGRTEREEIGFRLAGAVEEVLAHVGATIESAPPMEHRIEVLDLPMTVADDEAVAYALREADQLEASYREEVARLEADPELKQQPRWYVPATRAYRRMNWFRGVAERHAAAQTQPTRPAEIHIIRLGDMAFATNPFEYYLDHGMYIKARSPAVQTFVVQLAGSGTYVPSSRSLAGGGYGSMPASNPVGPAGGRELAERSVTLLTELFAN